MNPKVKYNLIGTSNLEKEGIQYYRHKRTQVILPENAIDESNRSFWLLSEQLANQADYGLEDIQFEDSKITIVFHSSDCYDEVKNGQELNRIWWQVDNACRNVLYPAGYGDWVIDIGICEDTERIFD